MCNDKKAKQNKQTKNSCKLKKEKEISKDFMKLLQDNI